MFTLLTFLVRVALVAGLLVMLPLIPAMAKDMKGWANEN